MYLFLFIQFVKNVYCLVTQAGLELTLLCICLPGAKIVGLCSSLRLGQHLRKPEVITKTPLICNLLFCQAPLAGALTPLMGYLFSLLDA